MALPAGVIALSLAGTAHAADAPVPAAAEPAETGPTTNDVAAEVTVTARKRTEKLLTTPVSATVLSAANLDQQNIRNFQDLRGAVSNLEVLPQLSGGTAFTVRGIGQLSNQVNADTKTGFYVDEMYVGRQEGNSLYMYDIANLQVLKGPQGTLFGKNTTAGAVILTTQRPTGDFGGYVKVRGGSYGRIETEGAINLPLNSWLDSRISFRTQNVDGYIKHVLDSDTSGDVNNKSIRAQLRGTSGPLTVDLLGEYDKSSTDGGATIPLGCLNTAAYVVNYDANHTVPFCSAYPVLGKPYLVYGGATLSAPTSTIVTDKTVGGDANGTKRYAGQGPFNDTEVYTFNGRLSYDLSDTITLHSVTTYRDSKAAFYTPTLDAPNDIYAEHDYTATQQFTQELTLGGTALDDRLNFLGGLYYYNQKTVFNQDTGPDWIDPLGYIYDGTLKYESYAAFAQASFKVTPKFEITLGGRYTYDKKTASSSVFYTDNGSSFVKNGQTYYCNYNTASPVVGYGGGANGGFNGDFIGGLAQCAGAPFTAADSHHWDGFDPKIQLSYKLTDEVFVYATAAHGYNAGGFNQQLGFQTADGKFVSSYNPEKLWSYEGGIKADLFDHKLFLNLSGFYQKFSSIQATVLATFGLVTTRQVQSAADAHEAGMEAEFTIRPTPDLTIRGNASYLTQAYDKILPGATSFTLDTPVNSAPKYTFSAAVDYAFHVGNESLLTPSVDVRGVGAKPACQSGVTYICETPAYALVGVRLEFVPSPTSPWRVAFWGTNVLDKVVQLSRTGYFGGMGVDRYTPGRPQEFGGDISFKF